MEQEMFKINTASTAPSGPRRRFRGTFAATVFTSLLALVALPTVTAVQASPAVGTWTQQFGGANAEVRDFSRTDANHLWASGSYGRVMRSTDGGQNWSISYMPDPVMVMQGIKFVDN